MARCAIPPRLLLPDLESHALVSASDPVTAARVGTPLLGRHRFVAPGDGEPFSVTLHAVATGAVTLAQLRVDGQTDLVLEATAPRILVVEPGHDDQAGTVVQPGRPATVRCPAGGACRLVGIEVDALLVHLSRLIGGPLDRALVFDPRLCLDATAAHRWSLAVEMLVSEQSEEVVRRRSGIGAQLEELLMSSLLFGQRSTYSDLLGRPTGLERRAITVARSFIEANLSDRLTLDAVAAAAGISVRTLQASFRTELRTTPTAYIRSRRLDRAHDDLCDPDAPASTVTDVATRWGITHLGRFAAEYRTRYGEPPSETLRRQRR